MEGCPQLLDLITKDREWLVIKKGHHGVSDDKKLELRLGPPGEDQPIKQKNMNNQRETDQSLLSLAHFSSLSSNAYNNNTYGVKGGVEAQTGERNWLKNSCKENQCQKVLSTPWPCGPLPSPSYSAFQRQTQKQQQLPKPSFLQYPLMPNSLAVMAEESSKAAELQYPDKKACSTPADATVSANSAVPTSSHKRSALAPVVGWPPIRSFRKNLATSSSWKPETESPNETPKEIRSEKSKSFRNSLFVKINMDGVPIGRKVNIKAYDSYEKLSSAIDELFRALLAAQRDSYAAKNENKMEETKTMTGLVDGSGEYTLVYEDNEGDRMLVGDVPWHMFVSTVKRLRVMESSELSTLHISSSKQEKTPLDSAVDFRR